MALLATGSRAFCPQVHVSSKQDPEFILPHNGLSEGSGSHLLLAKCTTPVLHPTLLCYVLCDLLLRAVLGFPGMGWNI